MEIASVSLRRDDHMHATAISGAWTESLMDGG